LTLSGVAAAEQDASHHAQQHLHYSLGTGMPIELCRCPTEPHSVAAAAAKLQLSVGQIVSTAASNGAAAMDASCMVSVVVGEKDAESRGVRWTTRRRERCGDHAARPAAVAHRHVHGHRRRVPRPRQPRGACGDSMREEKGQPSSTVHGMHKMD